MRHASRKRCCLIETLLLVGAIACSIFSVPASAQLVITSTSIADGQANVPLVDSIYFYVNQQLPFNSLFTSKFHWEPTGHYQRTEVFLNQDRMSPRFRLIHQQNYDFSVYVFGVAAANGQKMQRPFALNYTTSPSSGSRQVSGTVQFGTRVTPSQNPKANSLADLIRREHQQDLIESARSAGGATASIRFDSLSPDGVKASGGLDSYDPTGDASSGTHRDGVASTTDVAVSTEVNVLNRTVILLLDEFSIEQSEWSVKAAAAITATGTYNFAHVRNGTYYPIAFNYSDDDGTAIGHYGYYDSNADFEPDPIVVLNGNVSNVSLTLYPYGSVQAFGYRTLAEDYVESVATDAKLVNMRGDVALNGTTKEWSYLFYSAALNKDINVFVDPLTVSHTVGQPSSSSPTTTIPPSGVFDSAPAVGVADANGGSAYRNANPGNLTISVTGGNQLSGYPTAPTVLLWMVRYSVLGSTDPPFLIYIDMATGEPVDQLPVELDAFDALVDGREITLSWSTLSETNNAGFSVEQRSAESGDWTTIGYVPGGGTTSHRTSYHVTLTNRKPGRYHFRLKQIDSDGRFVYSGAIEAVVLAESTLVVEAPWPNPADASASIVVSASTSATVVVSLYDVVGRRVSTLYDAPLGPDQSREIRIDTASLPGGLYFVRAESGRDTRVTQLIVR